MLRCLAVWCMGLVFGGVTLQAAHAPQKDPLQALAKIPGLVTQRGDATINGVDQPILFFTETNGPETLLAKIRQGLKGEFSVARTVTPAAFVIIIADIQSADCPTCRVVTKDNLQTIMQDAVTVSLISIPSAKGEAKMPLMAFGSKTGALVGTKAKSGLAGFFSEPLTAKIDWEATMDLRVADQRVRMSSGIYRGNTQDLFGDFASLQDKGTLVPLADQEQTVTPETTSSSSVSRRLWFRKDGAALIETQAIDHQRVRVTTYETRTQPRS